MADEILEPGQAPETAPSGGLRAFVATPLGKVVAIGAAIGGLLTIAAIVGVVLFVFVLDKSVDEPGPSGLVTPPQSVSATSTPGAEETTTVPDAVPDSEVFTFRDVFQPLLSAPKEPAAEGSTEASGTAPGDANVLYLQDVVVEEGEDKAVLAYNGAEYTLAEGEIVTGTPWQVLSIQSSSDTVLMLYGDSQVSLTVGQGTSSDK